MSRAVHLLFGVHAHQPVGNFGSVIDDALMRCYRPFLEAVERHPRIVISLHVSGWLLGYLGDRFPNDVARIVRMVRSGQIEMIGGGDTEPILAAIPERDRLEQLRAMTVRLEAAFDVRPRGAWLTERIWEATIVASLHRAGIRFVAVDDSHLRQAGVVGTLDGYYTTEEGGTRLDIFPISEELRYLIPFAPPADVVGAIERTAGGRAAIYFDDIEKFGVWPDTYEWVYERGWLEELFARIEASPRIQTQAFGAFHRADASRGLVYPPSTSYKEMNEWLHGGTWKDFLLRYPEANWMHKRMLDGSRRLHALPRRFARDDMRTALQRAQANDAYWHGLFGGIYLPFLRASVFANLARLDVQLDAISPLPASWSADLDLDGRAEIGARSKQWGLYVKPAEGGRLCELMHYVADHNFADALARREEDYYDVIRHGGSAHPPRRQFGIASAHDRVAFKVDIAAADLETDRAPRGLFVDAWFQNAMPQTIAYRGAPLRGEAGARCRARIRQLQIEKTIRIAQDASGGSAIEVRYALAALRSASGSLSTQLDLAMPSAGGPGGRLWIDGSAVGGFGTIAQRAHAAEVVLEDGVLGGTLTITSSPPCALHAQPLITVSRSESGFEKIMQAVTLTLSWPLALGAGEREERSVSLRYATAKSSDRLRADAPAARDTDTSGSGS